MPDMPRCEECGVPRFITGEHTWLDSGAIVMSNDPTARMAFVEADAWDPIWEGIAELAGRPIEHIVIGASRRATRMYIQQMFPKNIQGIIGEWVLTDPDFNQVTIMEGLFWIGSVMGYGKSSYLGHQLERRADDFLTVRFVSPFSIPLTVGTVVGVTEVFHPEGAYVYERLAPDAIDVTYFPEESPEAPRHRLRLNPYEYKAGVAKLERCSTCGGPIALSDYSWDSARGIIKSLVTGRRMVMIGPPMIDPLLAELELELGEGVPLLVVEAQRRFTRNGPFKASELTDMDELARQLAIRGLGDLRDLRIGPKGAHVLIDNASMPLLVAGFIQGFYEIVFGEGSDVDWEVSNGHLEVAVLPSYSPSPRAGRH